MAHQQSPRWVIVFYQKNDLICVYGMNGSLVALKLRSPNCSIQLYISLFHRSHTSTFKLST